MLKVGDCIIINDPRAAYHGEKAVIVRIRKGKALPYKLRVKSLCFDYWFRASEVEEVAADNPVAQPTENVHDFSHSGLGIGGLGRHEEAPIIPSIAAMKRVENLERQAHTCRKCGQTDVFDGAMFTTAPSSGLCDDCFE